MGIVCCHCYHNQLVVDRSEQIFIDPEDDVLNSANSINLIEMLGKDSIDRHMAKVDSLILNDKMMSKKNELVKGKKMFLYKNLLKFWIRLDTQEDSDYKLHNYYTQLEIPFTAEFIYLFLINISREESLKLDSSLSNYEVLNYTVSQDLIVMITKTTTKKILIVQPRSFIVVKIIKLNEDKSVEEYQKSIHLTKLGKDKSVEQYLKKVKNMGIIHDNVIRCSKKEDQWYLENYNKLDVLSSIGLKLVKGTIKKKMIRYNKKFNHQLTEFLLCRDNFYDDLVWFTNDREELKRIFNENFEIFESKKIGFFELSEKAQRALERKTNEKNKKVVKSEIVTQEKDVKKDMKNILLSQTPQIKENLPSKQNLDSIQDLEETNESSVKIEK